MSTKTSNGKKIGSATIFILTGLIFIMTAIAWEGSHEKHTFFEKIAIGTLAHFGIGALVIGVIGILIDTSHWVEYFKARLAEIVIDKKYMENLSSESLISLQTEVLKVYFKDEGIGGNDGFLQYYQKHIQKIVGSPFRINMESDIRIDFCQGTNEKIIVHEQMSWKCKANGGKIQNNITWEPSEDEFEKVNNLALKLEHELLDIENKKKEKTYIYSDLQKWQTGDGKGFIFPLANHIELDGLKVTISSEVVVSTNKFLAFRMAHPSRGLSLSIRYPKQLTIIKELFGIEEDCDEIDDKGNGYYKLSSQKWILPDEGIAFQLSNLNNNGLSACVGIPLK